MKVENLTSEGYAEALIAAADEIKRRAVELIGDIDQTKGYEITIYINPQDVVTIVQKKTMYAPVAITGGDS
jgi:hypothetical protein